MILADTLYLPEIAAGWRWALGLGSVGLLALLWLGYRRQPLTPGVKLACMSLKFIAVALLLLMLLEPMWTKETAKPGSNDFLILADNGEGMQIQDGQVLAEKLRTAREEPSSWYGQLDELFRVESFTFDTRLRKSGGFENLDLTGQRSDLIHAIESLTQRYAKRPLAGMLVFTDGNATDAAKLEALKLEIPIFPVVVEGGRELRDLALGAVGITESAFEDAPISVAATAKIVGMREESAALSVVDTDGKEVLRESHKIEAETEEHPFRVRFRPTKPGVSFYQVALERETEGAKPKNGADGGETTLRNNSRTIAIDRGRGPYRVLYLTGRPNWEYKFLRRALEPDDELDLVGLVRVAKREPKFVWRGRRGESSNPLFRGFQDNRTEEERAYDQPVLIRLNTRDAAELRNGFPKEREQLFADYHAIIIDDLEADFFTEDQQLLVEKFVSLRGGSVLMLGGQESMQWGGYKAKPIGQMLPVYLDKLGQTQVAATAMLKLTREGWLEPWARLRLTEEEEEIRLAHMPAFQALNELKAIKPGASPVATAIDENRREYPALVTHRFGEGRVAVMTVADLWRWGMADESLHEDMNKWWRQLVRWMVVDVPEFIRISTEWSVDSGGFAKRNIQVRIRNGAFRPEENATVELQVSRVAFAEEKTAETEAKGQNTTHQEPSTKHKEQRTEDKLFAEPSLDEPGLFTAEFSCAEPGAYHVKAIVDDAEGIRLGEAESGWTWNPAMEEFARLEPNRALLTSLAEQSGGRVLAMADLADFAKSLPEMEVPRMETQVRPLWHQPWVFLLVLLLFAGEWGLRRWNGLA